MRPSNRLMFLSLSNNLDRRPNNKKGKSRSNDNVGPFRAKDQNCKSSSDRCEVSNSIVSGANPNRPLKETSKN